MVQAYTNLIQKPVDPVQKSKETMKPLNVCKKKKCGREK